MTDTKLYTYWRSTAAYRVRIALNLKGVEYTSLPVHLIRDGGEQHKPEFRQRNPWFRSLTDAELAPALVIGEPVECLERLGHLAALLRLDLPIVDLSGVDADTVRRTIEALPAGNALR